MFGVLQIGILFLSECITMLSFCYCLCMDRNTIRFKRIFFLPKSISHHYCVSTKYPTPQIYCTKNCTMIVLYHRCRISRSYRVYRSVRQLNLDSRVFSISSRTGISVLNTGFDVNSSFVSFRPGLRVVKLNYILFR